MDQEKKFIRNDSMSESFSSIIDEESKRKRSFFSNSFDSENITNCERRIVYRSNGYEIKDSTDDFLKRNSIEFTRKKWVYVFDKCPSIKVIDRHVYSLADCHYNISGYVDAIIGIEDKIVSVKVQPVNDDYFEKIKLKGASRKHAIDLMICIWLSESDDGFLIYDNTNNNKYMVYHVNVYAPVIRSVKNKCLSMMKHKFNGSLPEKPYKSNLSEECIVCEFSKKCWEDNNDR